MYIVKSMNTTDAATLSSITPSYVEHVSSGESLICKILMQARQASLSPSSFGSSHSPSECFRCLERSNTGC